MNNNILNEFIKITEDSAIEITAHGSKNIYTVYKTGDDAYDLKVDNDTIYGLSCVSMIEIIGILIQDYANGIITDFRIIE